MAPAAPPPLRACRGASAGASRKLVENPAVSPDGPAWRLARISL